MNPDLCGTAVDEELVTGGLADEDGARDTMDEAGSLDGNGLGRPAALLERLEALADGVGFVDAEDELDDVGEELDALDEALLAEVPSTELESVPTTPVGLRVGATAAAAEEPDRDNGYATATATMAATTAAAPVRTTARRRFGGEGAASAAGSVMVKESSRAARPAPPEAELS
jgi:hypothetical protein